MAYRFKDKEILMILGAGSSVQAGIRHSNQMIEDLEELVRTDPNWTGFHDLYFYIKSTFEYGNSIRKITQPQYAGIGYNIESLYVTLDELSKRDEHQLFPFIGAWNPKLSDVAGNQFEKVKELKKKIFERIRVWVGETEVEKVGYYEKIFDFRQEYEFSLRVFSLNYDLCLERAHISWTQKNNNNAICLERGFHLPFENNEEKKRYWDWKRLDETQNQNEFQPVFLYKLHGSIDWAKDGEKTKFVDDGSWQGIKIEDSVFIFGETNKLHYNDPFFFLFQEFRKWALYSKLIIVVGYSFGDEHINNVIRQSLIDSPERKLLVVTPYFENNVMMEDASPAPKISAEKKEEQIKTIRKSLRLESACQEQIQCWFYGAKLFMEEHLKVERLATLFPEKEPDLIEEM